MVLTNQGGDLMLIYENGGKFKKGDEVTVVMVCPEQQNNGRSDHLVRDQRKVYVEGYSNRGNVKGHLIHQSTGEKQKSLCTFREYELDFL